MLAFGGGGLGVNGEFHSSTPTCPGSSQFVTLAPMISHRPCELGIIFCPFLFAPQLRFIIEYLTHRLYK